MSAAAGLQVGFGEFIGAETYTQVRELGFTVVRLDLQEQSQSRTRLLANEAIEHGLQPLCIIRRAEQMFILPEGALIDCGNEPDIAQFGWTRASYRKHALECVEIAKTSGQRLYVGVVSNTNIRGFDWLDDLPWKEWPDTIGCSVHRYPNGNAPQVPHKGFKSREDEVRRLRSIIGNRPLAITETGYTLAKFSEQEQASHLAFERRFWSQHGAELVVAYQINTGSGTDDLSLYGLRRPDGSWRPGAAAFTGAA